MKPSIRITLMLMILVLAVTCFAMMEQAETFTISGNTGLPGVVMKGLPNNIITDQNGHYSIRVPSRWKGIVAPIKEGYTFNPPARTYDAVGADHTDENYAASVMTFRISGSVGLPDVIMQGLPGEPMTASNGTYQATVDYGWAGTVRPIKQGYNFEPPTLIYTKVKSDMLNQNYAPQLQRFAPRYGRTAGRTDRGRVLVVPTTEVRLEEFDAITQDMQVMLYILEKDLQRPRLIQGVFVDYGDFFDRDGQTLQALYVQGYGAFFFMEVDVPLASSPQPQQPQAEKTQQQVDPVWQQAQREIFTPQSSTGAGPFPMRPQYTPENAEELKKEFIRILRHAANIRNLKPDEWVTLTVIGQGAGAGKVFGDATSGQVGAEGMQQPGTEESAPAPPAGGRSTGGYGAGGVAGYGGMYGMGGYGGGYGVGGYGVYGGSGGFGSYGGYGFGSMPGLARTEAGPRTVLTLRAKKSEVDAFAKGEIDFEQFQQKVKIFTY